MFNSVFDKPLILLYLCVCIFCQNNNLSNDCVVPASVNPTGPAGYKITCLNTQYSHFNITCPNSTVIALTGLFIGIRETCHKGAMNNVAEKCCSYVEKDQLLEGRCVRKYFTVESLRGLYDAAVRTFVTQFNEKRSGMWKDSREIPIAGSLGYNVSTSSYIGFRYLCVPKFKPVGLYSQDPNGLQMCVPGKITNNTIYLRQPISKNFTDCRCRISADRDPVNINIKLFDARFKKLNCSGSSLTITADNEDLIYEHSCDLSSWFEPEEFNITGSIGVIFRMISSQPTNWDSDIWLQIKDLQGKNLEIRCGIEIQTSSQSKTPLTVVYIMIGITICFIIVSAIVILINLYHRRIKGEQPEEIEGNNGLEGTSYDYISILNQPESQGLHTNQATPNAYDIIPQLASEGAYELLSNTPLKNGYEKNDVEDNYNHFPIAVKLNVIADSNDYDIVRETLCRADKSFDDYDNMKHIGKAIKF